MTLQIGQMVDNRYRVEKLLGQGGMGAVYRAWHTRLNRPIALKEMVPQPGLDADVLAELRKQFENEARVLATLSHANLVRVTDYFSWEGSECLVMDFVEGESLADRIQQHGPQPEVGSPEGGGVTARPGPDDHHLRVVILAGTVRRRWRRLTLHARLGRVAVARSGLGVRAGLLARTRLGARVTGSRAVGLQRQQHAALGHAITDLDAQLLDRPGLGRRHVHRRLV